MHDNLRVRMLLWPRFRKPFWPGRSPLPGPDELATALSRTSAPTIAALQLLSPQQRQQSFPQ